MKTVNVNKQVGVFNLTPQQYNDFIDQLDDERPDGGIDLDSISALSSYNKELLTKIASMLTFKQQDVETFVPMSTREIKQECNPKFIAALLDFVKDKNYRIHATSGESVAKIMQEGLLCRSQTPAIEHTSTRLDNETDNEILFRLFNKQHRNQRQIIIIDANSSDLVPYKGRYLLPVERIKGYIDLETQQVVPNLKFKPVNHVDDRKVTRKNKEIESSEMFTDINLSKQISDFEYLLKNENVNSYSHTLNEIYEFIRGILARSQPDPGAKEVPPCDCCFTSKQEMDKFIYFLAQVENSVKKFVKTAEKKQQKQARQAKTRTQAKHGAKHPTRPGQPTLDDTDNLFD